MKTEYINEEIEINAYYFSRGMKGFPRAITRGGQRYTFQDGLRIVIRKSPQASRLSNRAEVSPRSGLNRTNTYEERASERKVGYGAKKLAESAALLSSRLAGTKLVRLFDMSDGNMTYRLRNEDDKWTLIGMKPAV